MFFVPLLYLSVGVGYVTLRVRTGDRRARDLVEALIMIVFWPMHVVASDPPAPFVAEDTPLARVERWLDRLQGRDEVATLYNRMLDAHAWACAATAKGTPSHEIWRLLRPLFDECEASLRNAL